MKDYYAILEVGPGAGAREIRAAWRRQAFHCHPDRNPGQEGAAHARFLDLAEAWAVLGDPANRREYDDRRGGGGPRPAPRPAPGGRTVRRPDAPEAERSDRERAQEAGRLIWTVVSAETPTAEPVDPIEPREPPQRADESGRDYVRRLRRWRADVRRLAVELALRDRFGQLVDAALLLVAVAALGLVPIAWIVECGRAGVAHGSLPPTWIPPVSLLAGVVALAWFTALREGRIRRFRGYAAEVLRRRAQRGESRAVVRGT